MKVAIHVHTHGVYADPRLVADLAREAEAAGWDGVFVGRKRAWYNALQSQIR